MRYMYDVNELMKRPRVVRCVREPHMDGTTRVFDTEDRGAVAVFAGTPYKLIRRGAVAGSPQRPGVGSCAEASRTPDVSA